MQITFTKCFFKQPTTFAELQTPIYAIANYKHQFMINEYKFILEPYKGMHTRFHCPYCKHKDRKFTRYINAETGEHLADHVGKCERVDSCGVHYKPKQYFEENNFSIDLFRDKPKVKLKIVEPQHKQFSIISPELIMSSLKNYESNNFVNYLIELFGIEISNKLVCLYFIGTSKHWKGASIFWQVDSKGNVRTGKIMLYNSSTGKRVKEPYTHINWVHKLIKQPEFILIQCFFGEHLINANGNEKKTIAIVESEKTAIIASIYLTQFIWLAVGSLTNLNVEKCSILKGRNIILFPDLNGYEKWSIKAKEHSHIAKFTVSDLLECNATEAERKQGLDLADYLIRFNYKDFNIEPSKPTMDIEILPELQPIEVNNNLQNRFSPAYVSATGELYIETPNWTTYTIYPSVDHYNKMLCLPDFIDKDKISIDGFKVVQINLDLLKIIKAD